MIHDNPFSTPSEKILHGIQLQHTLRGHQGQIARVAWSPDGHFLASPSSDKTIGLWDIGSGTLHRILDGHASGIVSVAWSHDGQLLAAGLADETICFWDLATQKMLHRCSEHFHAVRSVSWSPRKMALASGSEDHNILLWEEYSVKLRLQRHTAPVTCVAWSPDGLMLASSSDDQTVVTWDTYNGKPFHIFTGHSGAALSVAWSPNGKLLASASADCTIRIWNVQRYELIAILEGPTNSVRSVSFSYDNRLLASVSRDNTIRLWRCDTWELVADFNENIADRNWHAGIAFCPCTPFLATLGENDTAIHIWQLDHEALINTSIAQESKHYRNAKVVLLGDTGVGKSGLSLVLTGQKFQPTYSSHGRNIYTFDCHEELLPNGRQEMREILLWDAAGQPGYRLIHQLYLNEVAVALVVFDARSENEPFAGVRYWDRALRQAQRLQRDAITPLKKFLVIARADRGTIAASRKRIETVIHDLNFDSFFDTSAKEGWQIPEMIAAIHNAISWEALPAVSSNELFQTIKTFLISEKEAGRVLATVEELYHHLRYIHPELTQDLDLYNKFKTCMGHVENRGLIRRLHFGGYVLLQPEKLDAYASAMVNAAKSEPDGLGFIPEEDALAGRFAMPTDERVTKTDTERLLLIATVDELIRHEIVLKEVSDDSIDLVFPSQFTRERPDAPDIPGKAVIFIFEGSVLNIYATLAVRLAHSQFFVKQEMWKDTASYRATVGGLCGISLRELDEGRGELTLFFDAEATEEIRAQFEDYVATHLERRAVHNSIIRRRIVTCAPCDIVMPDKMIRLLRARGETEMQCPVCRTSISILEREEWVLAASAVSTSEMITAMDRAADAKRDRNAATMILQGKMTSKDYDVFLCHNSKDKPAVKEIGNQLKERGILPWLDEWELRPGFPWQRILEQQIGQIRTAVVFVGSDGIGPWQQEELDGYLREFTKRGCLVIPVLLPNAPEKPILPIFLENRTWVDFRENSPNPIEQLIWGITGERGL